MNKLNAQNNNSLQRPQNKVLQVASEACNGPSSDGPLMELTDSLSYSSTDLPTVGSLVRFRSTTPTESGQKFKARVMSRAGKSTGNTGPGLIWNI